MAIASRGRLTVAVAALALLLTTLGVAGPAWSATGALGYTLPPSLIAVLLMALFLQHGRHGSLVASLVFAAAVLTLRGAYDPGFRPWLPAAVAGVFGATQLATWSLELETSRPPRWMPRLLEELLVAAAAGALTAIGQLLTLLPRPSALILLTGGLAVVGVALVTALATGWRPGSVRSRRPRLEPLHGQDE